MCIVWSWLGGGRGASPDLGRAHVLAAAAALLAVPGDLELEREERPHREIHRLLGHERHAHVRRERAERRHGAAQGIAARFRQSALPLHAPAHPRGRSVKAHLLLPLPQPRTLNVAYC